MKRKGRVENKFLKRMKNDYTFRTFVFSSLSCFVTVAFAGYNAILAISYRSAWNTGIAVYYTLLSCIRIYDIFSESKFYKKGLDEQRKGMQRKKRFLVQSILLFIIDFILIAPVAMMVMQQKEIHYTAIPAIAIAAYTTYKVTMSAKHFIKARKSNHLSIKMLRNINFVDALVSVLSLQYTLIMTFDGGSIKKDMHTLCAISSLIIWGWIIVISVFTLSRAIKLLQKNNVDI